MAYKPRTIVEDLHGSLFKGPSKEHQNPFLSHPCLVSRLTQAPTHFSTFSFWPPICITIVLLLISTHRVSFLLSRLSSAVEWDTFWRISPQRTLSRIASSYFPLLQREMSCTDRKIASRCHKQVKESAFLSFPCARLSSHAHLCTTGSHRQKVVLINESLNTSDYKQGLASRGLSEPLHTPLSSP